MMHRLMRRSGVLRRTNTHTQLLINSIHGQNAARIALNQIQSIVVRASTIPVCVHDEQRSRFFETHEPPRIEGIQALSSNPDDDEDQLRKQRIEKHGTHDSQSLNRRWLDFSEQQPCMQQRTVIAKLSSGFKIPTVQINQQNRQLLAPLQISPAAKAIGVQGTTRQLNEQRSKTLQLSRLQGLHPLGNQTRVQAGTQQVVLLRPSTHSTQLAHSQVPSAGLQPANNVLIRSHGGRISTGQVPTSVSNPEEGALRLRAAQLRLQAAQLEVQFLERQFPRLCPGEFPSSRQSQAGQNYQEHNGMEQAAVISCRQTDASNPNLQRPEAKVHKSNNKGKNVHIYDGYAYKSDGPPKKNGTQYADVARFMMFQPNVRKNMYYHRRQKQRAWKHRVRSMKQLSKVLKTDDAKRSLLMLEDPDGIAPDVRFETETVWVDKEPYIIFWDKTFVAKLEGSDVLQFDATFASRMKISGLRQFLTVMVRAYDKAFPAVFVNMPRKTEKAYVAVFKRIKKILNLKPRQLITDFEKGEQNALRKVFGSEVTLTSCHFHWNKAIWTNAVKRKVAFPRMSQKEPEKFEVIRKLMALPLLPQEFIYPTYLIIKADALEKFGSFFASFFEDYMEPYWFKQRGEKSFCVHGELLRTNNDEETYHRDLNHIFRHKRPAVKNSFHQLLYFVQRQHLMLDGMKEGFSKLTKHPVSAFNEKLLQEHWEKVPKKMTPIHFVTKMANEMKRHIRMTEVDLDEDSGDEGENGNETGGSNDDVDGVDDSEEDAESDNVEEDEPDDREGDGEEDNGGGSSEEDEDDAAEVEATHKSPMSDEHLNNLIQNLDEEVILNNKEEPKHREPDESVGQPCTHEEDPTQKMNDFEPDSCNDVVIDVLEVPKPCKVRGKTRKITQQEQRASNDTSTIMRSKRKPKPVNFDDYVVPVKRVKRS